MCGLRPHGNRRVAIWRWPCSRSDCRRDSRLFQCAKGHETHQAAHQDHALCSDGRDRLTRLRRERRRRAFHQGRCSDTACRGNRSRHCVLHTLRWMAVINANGHRLTFKTALRFVLIGHFFNQALPSSVGGDAMRVWCAYRAGLVFSTAAKTVIIDRLFTLVSLLAARPQ